MSRAMLPASYTRYKIRNPKSYAAHQEAIKHLPGGNTRSSIFSTPFPLTFTSGHKATLTSLDGDTYTDFLGEYSAGLFGHSNERISNAVSAAMAGGWNFGGISVHESAFAERVCDRFREAGMEMVRFTNSGTEANTMAIATALAFVNTRNDKDGNDETRKTITKSKILVFSNAYHGATLTFPITLVADADGGDDDGGGGKVVSGGTASPAATNFPHDFVIAPYNNIDETRAIVNSLHPRSSLAAILFEPMQGAGGCRTATKEFARFLRQVADEHSALLIADEVMTSRLAPAGLCVGLFGITPDIMTLGKWVGGGMSFGAFGGRREIMELYLPADPGERKGKGRLSHAGTFNNNILTMVAGFEALGIYTKERVGVLNRLGDRLRKGIWTLLADRRIISKHLSQGGEAGEAYGIVEVDTFDRERQGKEAKALPRMFVSGHGSLINVRFTGFEAKVWQALFYHHMLDEHIYLAMRGYMALTIETTEDDVDRLIRKTQDCETEI
ncbi:glutamate-1-semialdehyde 2,1-aminomutase [Histoplasma capsulatum var. duboisii H88]|uniref:Glutamate-1-semialdehyde 2,1-aminomutase n=1 Tax=Ajellomyces capsulatus (strain H88) TaxID=544711 RepID=F0U9J5_AJEC8|nr:glutamate-1-semialdehyde 2,1-aminomutase [Histoplasma capsulatum var. duboisii H88]